MYIKNVQKKKLEISLRITQHRQDLTYLNITFNIIPYLKMHLSTYEIVLIVLL